MPHRVIATQDRTIYQADGVTVIIKLLEDQEVVTTNEELKGFLLMWGWAKLYDDTKPYPPMGFGVYEVGKVYSGNRQVIYQSAMYRSKTTLTNNETSSTWVASEWDLILQGV